MLSEAVHIGHTLNATIFGPLNEPDSFHLLKSAIGRLLNFHKNLLNFHKNFNRKFAASWARNEQRRTNGVEILPPVPLFEFDRKIPIQEIIDDSALVSTRTKGRSLYARLAELPPEERQKEIDKLESTLRQKARRKLGTVIDFDTVETSAAVSSLFLDFIFPPLAGLMHLSKQVTEKLRHIPQIDQMIAQLESTFNVVGGNQELDFLSRINRVATFRREHV